MSELNIKSIIEAAIFAAGDPITLERLQTLFTDSDKPEKAELSAALEELARDYEDRGVQLQKVSSGYRFQAKSDYAEWLQRLWEKKPPRYSRAILETLALIAYKQPITRGEIESVRGVAVSSHIVKTLLDREWIKVIGYREVPGRPALLATSKAFLDYFNLASLADLPPLSELMDLDSAGKKLGDQLAEGLAMAQQQFLGPLLPVIDTPPDEVTAQAATSAEEVDLEAIAQQVVASVAQGQESALQDDQSNTDETDLDPVEDAVDAAIEQVSIHPEADIELIDDEATLSEPLETLNAVADAEPSANEVGSTSCDDPIIAEEVSEMIQDNIAHVENLAPINTATHESEQDDGSVIQQELEEELV